MFIPIKTLLEYLTKVLAHFSAQFSIFYSLTRLMEYIKTYTRTKKALSGRLYMYTKDLTASKAYRRISQSYARAALFAKRRAGKLRALRRNNWALLKQT